MNRSTILETPETSEALELAVTIYPSNKCILNNENIHEIEVKVIILYHSMRSDITIGVLSNV